MGDGLSWIQAQTFFFFLLKSKNSVWRHTIFNDHLMRNDCVPGALATEYPECARRGSGTWGLSENISFLDPDK